MNQGDRLPLKSKEFLPDYSTQMYSDNDYDTIDKSNDTAVDSSDSNSSVFRLERFAQIMECPNCKIQVYTSIKYKTGMWTWCTCLLFTVYGCVGCCFIPFCTNCLKDVYHTCPKCNLVLGVVKPV